MPKKSTVNSSRIAPLFLMMLAIHVAHVFEEIWGRFWLIDAVFGLGWFLLVNWLLFCIPVAILYLFLKQRRWALFLAMAYAGLMTVNGLGHAVAAIVTGRYFGFSAGAFTGTGLLLVGPSTMVALRKAVAAGRGDESEGGSEEKGGLASAVPQGAC